MRRIPHRDIGDLAEEDDALVETGSQDLRPEPVGKGAMLGGDAAGNDCGPVGISRQKRDHGVDEKVGPLLGPDAPEAADRDSGRAGRERKGVVGLARRMEALEVDAVHDHLMRARRGSCPSGALVAITASIRRMSHLVKRLVVALGGRCEDQMHRRRARHRAAGARPASRYCAARARCACARERGRRQQRRQLPPARSSEGIPAGPARAWRCRASAAAAGPVERSCW